MICIWFIWVCMVCKVCMVYMGVYGANGCIWCIWGIWCVDSQALPVCLRGLCRLGSGLEMSGPPASPEGVSSCEHLHLPGDCRPAPSHLFGGPWGKGESSVGSVGCGGRRAPWGSDWEPPVL